LGVHSRFEFPALKKFLKPRINKKSFFKRLRSWYQSENAVGRSNQSTVLLALKCSHVPATSSKQFASPSLKIGWSLILPTESTPEHTSVLSNAISPAVPTSKALHYTKISNDTLTPFISEAPSLAIFLPVERHFRDLTIAFVTSTSSTTKTSYHLQAPIASRVHLYAYIIQRFCSASGCMLPPAVDVLGSYRVPGQHTWQDLQIASERSRELNHDGTFIKQRKLRACIYATAMFWWLRRSKGNIHSIHASANYKIYITCSSKALSELPPMADSSTQTDSSIKTIHMLPS
jgi:hypothetical protein